MKRIQKFMKCDEINPSIVKHDAANTASEHALEFKYKSNFHWGYDGLTKPEPKAVEDELESFKPKKNMQDPRSYVQLKKLDLKIPKGQFVCIIGDVGSGKSSLLSALIGDMLHLSEEQLGKTSLEAFNADSQAKIPPSATPIVIN